jgi:hypothetical protein
VVNRLRYLLLAALALAVAAIVAVAFLARDRQASTARSLPRNTLLAASANLFPQSLLFGQLVHVRVDAVLDHRKLDPNGVRLQVNWSPYTPVEPLTRTRKDVGSYTRLRWQVALHCVVIECTPQIGSAVRKVFEPATLRYVGHVRGGGAQPQVTVTWPVVIAWSRLDAIDSERKALVHKGPVFERQVVAFGAPWHVDTDAAGVTYRFAPSTVFWTALALALALIAAAGLLVRPFLPSFVWRPGEGSSLERALEAVERARGRTVEERKALELLAAELRRSGEDRLAWDATELAWSESVPAPERTTALTAGIRRELAGRVNGHRR